MDKNKHLVWDAAENVLPKGVRPSAKPAAANDKLPVRLQAAHLGRAHGISWALIGGTAIAVVAIVSNLDW